MLVKKESSVLSNAACQILGQIHQAFEVLTGEQASAIRIDVNKGRGRIYVGGREEEILFSPDCDNLITFTLDRSGEDRYEAAFQKNGEVFVTNMSKPRIRKTRAGDIAMRWAGRSARDRREEPLNYKDALRCAQVRGMSLAQLLANQP